MTDAMVPEDEPISGVEVELAAEPVAPEMIPEVEFVVPAAAYDTIATDDELAPRGEPSIVREPDPAHLRDAIRGLGESLGKKLDSLQTLFDREIRAEATREKVVDRLHAELQQYKQDLLLSILRPVFIDLIQLHDDMGKIIEAQILSDPDAPTMRLADVLRGLQQGIEDILYRQGVEPFAVEGNAFDPRRQRAVATVETEEPALARTVAARLRKGFQAGEKIIRAEIVTVHAMRRSS